MRCQLDEEAAIRANTTICLGKIASHIDAPTREKVLIPACCRALKDPFPPGRAAGLMSLTATQQHHKPLDVATKILPNVAPVVLDPERDVRETALACLRVYVQRLEQASAQVGQPPQADGSTLSGDSTDLSKAADHALSAMSWLTSKVNSAVKEVATGTAANTTPNASGAGGNNAALGAACGGAGCGGAGGAPRPSTAPVYMPPAQLAPSPAGVPAARGSGGAASLEGWDDDADALNDAFSMPAPPAVAASLSDDAFGLGSLSLDGSAPPTAGKGGMKLAPPAAATPQVDYFATLGAAKPSTAPAPTAPLLAPPPATSAAGGCSSGMGGLGALGGLSTPASGAMAALPCGGMTPGGMGGMGGSAMGSGMGGRTGVVAGGWSQRQIRVQSGPGLR